MWITTHHESQQNQEPRARSKLPSPDNPVHKIPITFFKIKLHRHNLHLHLSYFIFNFFIIPHTTPNSNSTPPKLTAALMAAFRYGPFPPLRAQHFHRHRMGLRTCGSLGICAHWTQRNPMGQCGQRKWIFPGNSDCQTP